MKNILITGASGGIGKACCRAFLDKGCNVAALYFKNEEGAKELRKYAVNSKFVTIKADITSSEDVKTAFKTWC